MAWEYEGGGSLLTDEEEDNEDGNGWIDDLLSL